MRVYECAADDLVFIPLTEMTVEQLRDVIRCADDTIDVSGDGVPTEALKRQASILLAYREAA